MYTYDSLFDMYEKDKVPMEHRVPKMIADEWHGLSKVLRTEETKNCWKIVFESKQGGEYCLSVVFPKLGGVRIYGERQGFFDCETLEVEYCQNNNDRVAYTSNGYSAHLISGNDFRLELKRNNKIYLAIGAQTLTFGYINGELKKATLTLPIHNNEKIAGFGEKYNGINQVGKLLPIHNDDTGYHGHGEAGDKNRSYKNVPLFHSSLGYSVFYNSFYTAIADLACENNTKFRLEYNSPLIDIYLWFDNIPAVLDSYTQLTGRPVLPPKWAFEYWAGGGGCHWAAKGKENFREVFKEAVDGYKKIGTIPSAFFGEAYPSQHKECYDMVAEIGSRMLAWNHPGVDIDIIGYDVERLRNMFPEMKDEDIPMLRDPETKEILDRRLFYMDYTHPFIHKLMDSKYEKYIGWGLHGAMVDFGEFVQQNTLAYNGMNGDEMHNFYGYCYSKAVHDVWERMHPDDYILFARAACAGSQKWVGFFAGDQNGEMYGLRQAYYGGINAGLTGLAVWGSDIGSLSSCTSEDVYLRWLQFGAFSPLMRLHGNHNPWNYGERAVEVFKKYFWLRKNIVDYIYSTAIQCHKSGMPYIRMMSAMYPDDVRLRFVDDQYMFGDSLMVCPVIYESKNSREVVFPEGVWYDLYSGAAYKGGTAAKIKAPLDTCPVFVKGGSVMPITLANSLKLCDAIEGDGIRALLVAAANGESLVNTDKETAYPFTLTFDNGVLNISNIKEYPADVILVLGEVKKAEADSESLEVINNNGISAIKLSEKDRKEIKIVC